MIINVTYDSSAANAPAGFKTVVAAVVQYYDSVISNPITLNIDVGYGEIDGQRLGSGDLGESEGLTQSFSYSQIRNALIANATSSNQLEAVSTLPATAPVNGNFYLTLADATALGLISGTNTLDGYVGFSSTTPFAYSDSSGVPANEYDFYAVVAHEISEVMGRTSMLDTRNSFTDLDLFRYSAPGERALNGTQSPAYFSINGGTTDLAAFNTNPGGDFGDWATTMGADAFDAFSNPGVVNPMSQADLTLLNILGYDLDSSQIAQTLTAAQINTVYTDVLARPAAPAEQAAWVAAESSGTVDGSQVIADIVNSPEAQEYSWTVTRLYQAAFGRVPDPAGFAVNVSFLDPAASGHGTELQLAQAFAGSAEFASYYGTGASFNLATFIAALYVNVLDRTGSTAEINAWIATGESPAQILIGFSGSAEFQARANPEVVNYLTANSLTETITTGSLFQTAVTGAAVSGTPLINLPAASSTNADPTITGSAPANSIVTLYLDGSSTTFGTATVGSTGTWTFTVASVLTPGLHSFTATDTENGVTSPASAAVAIDIAPTTVELTGVSATSLAIHNIA